MVSIFIFWMDNFIMEYRSLGYKRLLYYTAFSNMSSFLNKSFIHWYCKILSCRFFFEFLLLHARTIAAEIHDEYVETMSKVYSSYFQSYTKQLWKLQVCSLLLCTWTDVYFNHHTVQIKRWNCMYIQYVPGNCEWKHWLRKLQYLGRGFLWKEEC